MKLRIAIVLMLTSFNALSADIFVPIDPRATYLHSIDTDAALGAIAIDLIGLGFVPGQSIFLESLGDFKHAPTFDENGFSLAGVFSNSAVLGASSLLNRVTGAIDAGTDFVTQSAVGEPTDIAEDFLIAEFIDPVLVNGVTIEIPGGAQYLFVSPHDAFWSDNVDSDANFGVGISAVPVPAAVWLFGSVAGLLGWLGGRGTG